jgi:hypothetical protein
MKGGPLIFRVAERVRPRTGGTSPEKLLQRRSRWATCTFLPYSGSGEYTGVRAGRQQIVE